MSGLPAGLVRRLVRASSRWSFGDPDDIGRQRRWAEVLARWPGAPRGWRVEPMRLGGVACEVLTPPDGADGRRALLFLHGGGYVIGSARGYRHLAGTLAAAAGTRAVVVDYRRAPEHPAPAALEDAQAVFAALAEPPVVAGDSAGGGLALALAVARRDAGLPPPPALGLICPWTDVRPELEGTRPAAPREPLLTPALTRAWARAALGGGLDPADPRISPGLADLSGLPPIVLHSGADDLIAPDAAALERRAREAGVPVEHTRLAGLWHDVHLTAWMIRGIDPVGDLGRALRVHLARPAPASRPPAAGPGA